MPESYLTYNALIRTNDITNLFYQLCKIIYTYRRKLIYIVIHIEKTLIYIVKTAYMQ